MRVKYELDVDVPEGFVLTGEYRSPKWGEWFLEKLSNCEGQATKIHEAYVGSRLILKKAWTPEPWMPKGCELRYDKWVEYWCFGRPESRTIDWPAYELADLYGETFVPPPDESRVYRT